MKTNRNARKIWESVSRGRRAAEIRFGVNYFWICEGRSPNTVYCWFDDNVIELTRFVNRLEIYVFGTDGIPMFLSYASDPKAIPFVDAICAAREFGAKI